MTWAGLDWYVISDAGTQTTLVLKTNYTTGAYGSSTTFEGSTAYTSVNNDFVNANATVSAAISDGSVISQGTYNSEVYYVRLPEQTELSTAIPNDSSTAFWTQTVNDTGLYFGNATGAQAVRYTAGSSTKCYQGRASTLAGITKSYSGSVTSYSYLSYSATSVVTSYKTGNIYCSSGYFQAQCGSSGAPTSYCDSTGDTGHCGWTSVDYGGNATGCSKRTTYTLGGSTKIGYRPVVTVLEK